MLRVLVFNGFTEPEQLKSWWLPKGWEFNVRISDFQPDGMFHYSKKPVDGDGMWVKFVCKLFHFTPVTFSMRKETLYTLPLMKIGLWKL